MVRSEYSEWFDAISGVPQGSVLGPTENNNNIVLAETVQAKDLGVWISNNLKWEKQVVAATQQVVAATQQVVAATQQVVAVTQQVVAATQQVVAATQQVVAATQQVVTATQQVVAATQQDMVVLPSVKRAFIHFDREMFNIVYNTYIRPHIEYCVQGLQTWSPYYAKDILMLEKVQCRATKLVIGLKELTYEERLTQLKLYRLEELRL